MPAEVAHSHAVQDDSPLSQFGEKGEVSNGVYLTDRKPPAFSRLPAPRPQALERLVHTISQRVGAYLEREGLLARDIENSYLQLEAPEESAINDLLGHSITYRMC